jgi:hypothetical protein
LLVGAGIGLLGVVLGGLGLIFALRAARIRRTAAG